MSINKNKAILSAYAINLVLLVIVKSSLIRNLNERGPIMFSRGAADEMFCVEERAELR